MVYVSWCDMCEKRGSKFFISFLKCRSNPRVWNFKHYGSKWSKKEKNISSLNRHYPTAFQKFCTNLYSHKRSMRGSFLFLIFAKNWYNCLLCLTLNFRVVTMDLRLFFCLFYKRGSLAVLQTHLSPFCSFQTASSQAVLRPSWPGTLPQVFPTVILTET